MRLSQFWVLLCVELLGRKQNKYEKGIIRFCDSMLTTAKR